MKFGSGGRRVLSTPFFLASSYADSRSSFDVIINLFRTCEPLIGQRPVAVLERLDRSDAIGSTRKGPLPIFLPVSG